MRGRDSLFDGSTAPPAPAELRRRIRAEIASAPHPGERPLSPTWRLLWALVVLLSLAAHLALDLSHRSDAAPWEAPLAFAWEGGAE